MTMEREQVEGLLPRLRNTPLRPREWDELLERGDVTSVSVEGGTLALVPRWGQLCLYFAFADEEHGRLHFAELWEALEDDVEEDGWPYTRVDLVEMPNRTWIEALLHAADFRPSGEWMEMERRELGEMQPPEIPEGYSMRRATADDAEAISTIEERAYGEDTDGEDATHIRLEQASWTGVLEHDGRVIGFAINDHARGIAGRIVSAAIDPDLWGRGLGRVLLEAAAYQQASQGASRAVVELNPRIGAAIRASTAAGYRPGRRGVEFRRPTDAAVLEAVRDSERSTGIKARFGGWR